MSDFTKPHDDGYLPNCGRCGRNQDPRLASEGARCKCTPEEQGQFMADLLLDRNSEPDYDPRDIVAYAKEWLASPTRADDPSDAIEAADLFARALVDLAEPVLVVHVDEADPKVRAAIEKMQNDLANASMHAFLHAPPQPWNDEPIWPVRRAYEQVCAENPERIKELNRQWDEMSAEERDAFAAAVLGPWLTEKEPNEA